MVYVVTYFYPDGSYAGIIGVYDKESKADSAINAHQSDYSDCHFIITESILE